MAVDKGKLTGLAENLVEQILALGINGRGSTRAGLWLLDGNERALRFYLCEGWTDT